MTKNRNRRRRRLAVILAAAAALAFAAYAFTATNTVDPSNAGDGTGTISGFTVENITYDLETADPTKIERVSFNLAPDGNDASARIGSGAWVDCAVGTTREWTCDFSPNPDVLTATQLRVVAVK